MLELYVSESCPYCKKVIRYMEDNCIEFMKNDISNQLYNSELLTLGGKYQVPFLYDTEREIGMYESDEIINYVSKLGE